jgi:membrane protease YdiL (CAAX protease family)
LAHFTSSRHGSLLCPVRFAIVSEMRWPLVGFAYLVLGVAALFAAAWRGVSPWTHPNPILTFDSNLACLTYSCLMGLAVAGLVVMASRALVGRVPRATRLHCDLRPLTYRTSNAAIILLAICSALGEELLFRGLLQPWIGLIAQAMVFGSLHQIAGPSRWVWMASATLMGIVLGSMYACAGSLAGPLFAHALINGFNFAYLRDHDPHREPRRLGGLLSLNSHRNR